MPNSQTPRKIDSSVDQMVTVTNVVVARERDTGGFGPVVDEGRRDRRERRSAETAEHGIRKTTEGRQPEDFRSGAFEPSMEIQHDGNGHQVRGHVEQARDPDTKPAIGADHGLQVRESTDIEVVGRREGDERD